MRMGIQLPESAIDVLKQVGTEIHCVLFELKVVLVSLFLFNTPKTELSTLHYILSVFMNVFGNHPPILA